MNRRLDTMAFLRNTWYVAAWTSEIGRDLFHRTILGEPVLMFRREDGQVVAMQDRCPHRFVPLHLGRLEGDTVQCGYHGLQFDTRGDCVGNPFDGKLPRNAKVKTYAVHEKHQIVWWWGGDAAEADPALIPDFSYLEDASKSKVPGYKHVKAHYELLVDNLADLSHTHILHRSNLGIDNPRGEHEVTQVGDVVHSRFWYPSIPVPPMYGRYLGDSDAVVDRWTEITWNAPGNIRLDAGVTYAGKSRGEGINAIGTHLFTPETETSTHYFYCHVRDFKVGDPAADESIRRWQQEAFHGEDAPMIEAQQQSMGGMTDLLALKPVLLASDAGAIRIRRVLAARIAAEEAARQAAST
ncbi:aromatic ring-hydroxylating dioxygenase subunit alpha [Ramlibacter sp. AW1]|uniref:Aromatic ring-hydroxylating dioxygenase subunit alpha n=1 Tax=Ramlibacter aurantiacus TaxID=2801330 RepID=A0A936ZV30_9BURK|nr:aromatic ring-hydroxylating dioxygenase subunit alpha [Ramlibacter aurantiacus]MBL0421109.1 aromatic ring-hydroxylating dioxygenase subunit alpha [Ramlibacter aurantiacus]